MTFTVSSDAVGALKPVSLPGEVSLIGYDKTVITWPVQAGGSTGNENSINVGDIILLAEVVGGGYLIIILSEGEPGAEKPFRLLSFSAPQLPQDLLDRYLLGALPDFLEGGISSSLNIIVSTRSGTGLSQDFYATVLQPFLGILGLEGEEAGGAAEASYKTIPTKDANTVKDFAQSRWKSGSHSTDKKETAILLSGDGGIVDLLNGITAPPNEASLPTIALIPLGTGNALFHSLHKPHYEAPHPPSPLVLSLRALLRGRASALPTFQATFSGGSRLVSGDSDAGPVAELTGAIVASYGFHSQLVWESDTPAYRQHGAKRFGMVAEELLKESHGYRAVVETPAGQVGGAGAGGLLNYALVTMLSNMEKTFTISPHGKPLDGVLRLVHFQGVDGPRTMEIMMAAYDGGKHVDLKDVGYEVVEEVKVTTLEEDARWRKVCIDGTIVEIPKDGSMTVSKTAKPTIQVLVLDA